MRKDSVFHWVRSDVGYAGYEVHAALMNQTFTVVMCFVTNWTISRETPSANSFKRLIFASVSSSSLWTFNAELPLVCKEHFALVTYLLHKYVVTKDCLVWMLLIGIHYQAFLILRFQMWPVQCNVTFSLVLGLFQSF